MIQTGSCKMCGKATSDCYPDDGSFKMCKCISIFKTSELMKNNLADFIKDSMNFAQGGTFSKETIFPPVTGEFVVNPCRVKKMQITVDPATTLRNILEDDFSSTITQTPESAVPLHAEPETFWCLKRDDDILCVWKEKPRYDDFFKKMSELSEFEKIGLNGHIGARIFNLYTHGVLINRGIEYELIEREYDI